MVFLATTITVDNVCDGYKIRYCFWSMIDNFYQIAYDLLAVFCTPIIPSLFALVYFVIIWVTRPCVLDTDNIILSGEPFALFIFNLIIFIMKSKAVPFWAGIKLIVSAIMPALLCIIRYFARQRGNGFDKMIQDIQYEVEKRSKKHKKTPIIKVKNTLKIMKETANQEKSTFLFMKHFTLVKPNEINEEDFPDPKLKQKIIDSRSFFFVDILIKFTLTIGTFLFYMQIGEKVNIH